MQKTPLHTLRYLLYTHNLQRFSSQLELDSHFQNLQSAGSAVVIKIRMLVFQAVIELNEFS